MSDELWVLCRERPVLQSGEPPGLTWNPDGSRGSYKGANVVLTDVAVVLPDGDMVVAVVTFSWSHRSISDGGSLAFDDLAQQIAGDARGVIFDPHEDVQSPVVTAYLRERDATYERNRQQSEEARERVATRSLPRTPDELREAFAAVILTNEAPEPRTTDPDARALFHRVTDSYDDDEHEEAPEHEAVFEEFALTLAREGVRIASGDYDLQRMFAAYGLGAALRHPELRAELERGGALARAICDQWRAHDAHRDKQRGWLRRAWPRIEAAELKFAPAGDPITNGLRRKPKVWPDELVDALIDACDRSVREWRTPHVAPFVERLGLSSHHAQQVIKHILLKRPQR